MDNPVFSQFVADAANIKESGRWAAMNEKIVCLAKNPGVGNAWQVQLLGALCFQVLSEYRHLQGTYSAERNDPSLLAWRARNLLELSVWSTYLARSRENARRLYEDAGRDAKNLLDVFEHWGEAAGQPIDWLSAIADGKNDLSRRAAGEGIGSLDGRYMRVEDAADECGLKDKFKTMNKMLSKFAHTQLPCKFSAWPTTRNNLCTETHSTLSVVASSSAHSARLKAVCRLCGARNQHEESDDNLEEDEDQREGRKRRRLSLSADRREDQGARRLAGRDLARIRALIREADPEVVEEVKWRKPSNSMLGVPVWEHAGIICTGETYKAVVKLTFAKGAALEDPSGLFNSSLEGNVRRAIHFHEGDKIDAKALVALIRAAVALNTSNRP